MKTADLGVATGSIIGVAVNTVERKDDGGSRTMNHRVGLTGGSELAGAVYAPVIAYNNFQTMFPTKPGGGSWTVADVDNMEIGYEILT
jgi:hypothetical protein